MAYPVWSGAIIEATHVCAMNRSRDFVKCYDWLHAGARRGLALLAFRSGRQRGNIEQRSDQSQESLVFRPLGLSVEKFPRSMWERRPPDGPFG